MDRLIELYTRKDENELDFYARAGLVGVNGLHPVDEYGIVEHIGWVE